MVDVLQFAYVDSVIDLPVIFLNCGRDYVTGKYCWDGVLRHDVNGHSIAIWQYTISGSGMIEYGGRKQTLNPGDAFLVATPDEHQYYLPRSAKYWEFIYFTVAGDLIIELTKNLRQKLGTVIHHPQDSPVVRKALDIFNKYNVESFPDKYKLSALAYEFWMDIASEQERFAVAGAKHTLRDTAALYLQKNFNRHDCSVGSLAEFLGYSRAHFSRKFIAECGISPGKFMMDYRLQMAAQILSTEYCQIKEVAWRTGFVDVSHFCRVFRRKFQVTPEEYRSGEGKRR